MPTAAMQRLCGWSAILAALAGFVGFGFLVAALLAPTPSPETLRRYPDLFRFQDAGVLLQAMAMIPVTLVVGVPTQRTWRSFPAVLGIVAQAALVVLLLLRFANVTSDMLYMLPQGVVGVWLLVANRKPSDLLAGGLARTGLIAGLGLLIVGAGFLIYGALVAPGVFAGPLTNAEIDAQAWTPANVIAHLCLALGTVVGRFAYPVWTLLLARNLLRRGPTAGPIRG